MAEDLKKIGSYLIPMVFSRQNAPRVAASTVVMASSMTLNLLLPYIFNEVISLLISSSNLNFLNITITPLGMAGIYGVAWTLGRLSTIGFDMVVQPIATRSAVSLSHKYMEHLMKKSMRYHIDTKRGEHFQSIHKCFTGFPDLIIQSFTKIVPAVIEIIITMALLGTRGYELTLCLLGILIMSFVYNYRISPYIANLQDQDSVAGAKLYSYACELLDNYETIHIFGNLNYELEKTKTHLAQRCEAQAQTTTGPQNIALRQILIVGLGFIALSLLATDHVTNHIYSMDEFIIVNGLTLRALSSFFDLGNAVSKVRATMTVFQSVIDFLESPLEIEDKHPKVELKITDETATIDFENVTFGYSDDKTILRDVSLHIPAGKKVAVVGESGGGKSTLGKLLLRFFDLNDDDGGDIKIAGQSIKSVGLASLRSAVGVVPQMPMLTNGTLQENIEYSIISKVEHASKKDLTSAIEKANLSAFVQESKEGLATIIGERGTKLSGGQKQRVAIARVLLQKPNIFLFDEATSALDSKTENEVQKNLDEISKGKTTLVITHRIPTIINADLILYIKDGQIIEKGTHQELVELGGEYAKSWRMQCEQYEAIIKEEENSTAEENEENEALEMFKRNPINPVGSPLSKVLSSTMGIDIEEKVRDLPRTSPNPSPRGTPQFGIFAAPKTPITQPVPNKSSFGEVIIDIKNATPRSKQAIPRPLESLGLHSPALSSNY